MLSWWRTWNIHLTEGLFIGTVPSELARIGSYGFALAKNPLTGTLPTEFGLLSAGYLRLDNTQISGTFPSWFSSLTNLEDLGVEHTLMGGTIPEGMGALVTNHSLRVFDVNGTLLTGSIPDELCEIIIFECGLDDICGCNCTCSEDDTNHSIV